MQKWKRTNHEILKFASATLQFRVCSPSCFHTVINTISNFNWSQFPPSLIRRMTPTAPAFKSFIKLGVSSHPHRKCHIMAIPSFLCCYLPAGLMSKYCTKCDKAPQTIQSLFKGYNCCFWYYENGSLNETFWYLVFQWRTTIRPSL